MGARLCLHLLQRLQHRCRWVGWRLQWAGPAPWQRKGCVGRDQLVGADEQWQKAAGEWVVRDYWLGWLAGWTLHCRACSNSCPLGSVQVLLGAFARTCRCLPSCCSWTQLGQHPHGDGRCCWQNMCRIQSGRVQSACDSKKHAGELCIDLAVCQALRQEPFLADAGQSMWCFQGSGRSQQPADGLLAHGITLYGILCLVHCLVASARTMPV